MSIGVKKKFVFMVVLAVALVLGLGAAFWAKLGRREIQIEVKPVELEELVERENLELVCMTDTKEEAEKLAEDYGIELISYVETVAVFQTDKTYEEIVEIGKDKGLPELSRNSVMRAY